MEKSQISPTDIEDKYNALKAKYLDLRTESTKLELGFPIKAHLNEKTLPQEFAEAEIAYNDIVKLQVKLKREKSEQDAKLYGPKKDFSKYTISQYNKLEDFFEKYECFKQMFQENTRQVGTNIGKHIEKLAGPSYPVILKKPQENCTYAKMAFKLQAQENYLFILGTDVILQQNKLVDTFANVFDKKKLTDNKQNWSEGFKLIDQAQINLKQQNQKSSNFVKTSASLFRFIDFCKVFGKKCYIYCSTQDQLLAMQEFKKQSSQKTAFLDFKLIADHQKSNKWQDVKCNILLGNAMANKDINNLVVKDLLDHERWVIDLTFNKNTVPDEGFYFQTKNDQDKDNLVKLICAYMEYFSGMVLQNAINKQKLQ